jgi:thiosulfate reductase cytochrome b subunit
LVRITHWVNVVCLAVLLFSGLQIFNAHPALYWGQASDFAHPLLSMWAGRKPDGELVGVTTVLGHPFETTGLLGLSSGPGGEPLARGFPSWLTLPGPQWLAVGRHWHLAFAWLLVFNGLVYLGHGLASGHIRRDLLPDGGELRGIGPTIANHLRLRFHEGDGEGAPRYNVLQKLAYAAVALVMLPVMILAGLAMSPGLDAAFPLLLSVFDGRQSARTVHFLIALALVGFVVVHVAMVLVSGVWNNLRSMVTGWYVIAPAAANNGVPGDGVKEEDGHGQHGTD